MQEKSEDKETTVNMTVNQMIIIELNRAGYDNKSIAEAIGVSVDILHSLYCGRIQQTQVNISAKLLQFYYACLFRDVETQGTHGSLEKPNLLHSILKKDSGNDRVPLKKSYNISLQERKNYYLGQAYGGVYFTQREVDCINYLVQGRTIPATAKILGLSARTVEFYVNNMKIKIGVRSKKELLRRVLKSDLMKHINI